MFNMDFSYSKKLILPYEEGLKLIAAIAKAEVYDCPYGGDSSVRELKKDDVTVTFLSPQEYSEARLSSKLNT